MDGESRRMGRPRKNPADVKRQNLTFRVGDTMLARLKSEADAKGMSLSEIVEMIVNRHLHDDDAMRVIRETVRQEMRAEFAARRTPPDGGDLSADWLCPVTHGMNGL